LFPESSDFVPLQSEPRKLYGLARNQFIDYLVVRFNLTPEPRPDLMRRRTAAIWLKLLLVVSLAIGPWPVFADNSGESNDCCMKSMQASMDCPEKSCDNASGSEGCGMNHGCPGGHCPVTAFLPSTGPISLDSRHDINHTMTVDSRPTGTSAPPTPPPII
jgi:hypothetical protein